VSPLGRTAAALLAVWFVVSALAAPPYIQILPKPPQDLAGRNASQEDLAKFAWQEFLALNWKASIDAQHPPSPSNPRGTPDPAWNHSNPAPKYPNPLVWQTYAQTTELRPNGPLSLAWRDLGIPKYSYSTPPVLGGGLFTLWNNLDEDNEIGSCNIYGQYAKQPSPKELVLFQVKVNRDEYEYIRQNYTDQNEPAGKLFAAAKQVQSNIVKPPYAYYGSKPVSTCNCPPEQAICLPCGLLPGTSALVGAEGAIEVKSAWRRLMPGDDPTHFYTTTAIYYDLNSSSPPQIAWYNDTFALVAMHIIHKTTNFPDFVFATFEQVDVERSDANFILLDAKGAQLAPPVQIKRQIGQTNRQLLHPVPPTLDEVTANVRKQLVAMNPSTVWQYYRLTGVSGASTDCPVNLSGNPVSTNNCISYQDPTLCTSPNPNYYMANFMVESDPFLNNFSGPGFANSIFAGGCQNTVYANKIYDNGGCKGCHGVAQTAFGTDFSFLLDFNNNKPAIHPATIHYDPPGSIAAKVKLKHYLDVIRP
jgi:hypothetical protein